MAFGGSRIVSPSIAGFLIAAAGAPAVFLLSAIGISSMIAILFLVRPAASGGAPHGSLLDNFTDSVRYIRQSEVFTKVILAALLNAALVMGYQHMLPVFAKSVLGVDSRGLGILATCAGIGALSGLLTYPWVQARHSPRNVMVYALSAYTGALAVMALSPWFALSCALLVCAGMTQAWFMTSTQVILQTLVEDAYRGRVMGVFTQVWSLVYLSGFLLNFTGSLVGPGLALAGSCAIVLVYVWTSLARSERLAAVSLAPRQA
jgi:predicted MFS family arabinose efflux permease